LLVAAGSFFEGVDISGDIKQMFRASPVLTGVNLDELIPPLFLRPADKLLSLKVGDELYGEPLDHEVDKDRRFTFDVSFNEPTVIQCEPAIKTLQDMTNLVDEIVLKLGRFLP
jgi:hypothetical protein